MTSQFFNPGTFMPHGGCYLWTTSLIALHAISDASIGLAYYSIPFTLLYFVLKRKDLKFPRMFGCFALFVLACGTTHLMEIWNIWHANYWLSGGIKASTATVSVMTAFLLVKLLPQALALPSADDLRRAHDELEIRVRERTAALEEATRNLQAEVAERKQVNTDKCRLAAIVECSEDGIIAKTLEGVITSWNYGAARLFGYVAQEAIGQSIQMIIPPELVDEEKQIIRRILEGEKVEHFETVRVAKDGQRIAVSATISPIRNERGEIVGASKIVRDITERKQVEVKLNCERDLWRALFKNSPDKIFFKDNQSRFVKCSQAMATQFGLATPEAMVGKTDFDFFDVSHAQTAFEDEQQILLTGQPMIAREEREQWRNGQVTWVSTTKLPWHDGNGKIIGTMGISRDITERKWTEETLRKNTRLLKESQNIANLGSYMFDIVNNRWDSSAVLDRVFGIDPAFERSLEGWTSLIHPDDLTGMLEHIKKEVLTQNQPFNKEYRIIRHNDQAERWVHGLGRLEFDAQGVPIKLHGTIQDITERKLTEKSHARLATAVEQSVETIVITDTDGTILYANPAFEKTTGYTRAEALGQNPRLLKSDQQDAVFYRQMWEVLKRGEVWQGHFINKRKDGKLYEEDGTITPVRDAAGKVVNYVAVKRDVTREVQLEAQFRQSQKMEAIGQLAGGVAHDFNNILAAQILQVAMLALEPNLSAEVGAGLENIRQSADRAANLVRQLLLFSRRKAVQMHDLNLNETVSNLTKMLQRVIGEDIQLQLHLHPAQLPIHGDPGMLEQVLMNLCVNSRDAMPSGGRILLETTRADFDETAAAANPRIRPGSFVCLSVTDIGGGIAPEILPRIFEPFFTTKDVGKGTGLGLATVYGIIQQHQGWINVDSEIGQGTTFRVYLPRLLQPANPGINRFDPAPLIGGSETILLVEDDPALRCMVSLVLSRLGYCVREAADGAAALAVWRQHQTDINLLLTDLVMPGSLPGQVLAERLLVQAPQLKVIYTSGYSTHAAAQNFPLEEGVNYLTKPYGMDQLTQIIRRQLDAR